MALEQINRYRIAGLRKSKNPVIGLDLLAEQNWVEDPITGCWLWKWASSGGGYAVVWHSGKPRRVANILAGTVGQQVHIRHESFCDIRCINPAHLTVGTPWDNFKDSTVDGNHNTQILTVEQAYHIKFHDLLWRNGRCYYRYRGQSIDLARDYGVSVYAIRDIKQGKSWGWLRPDMDLSELKKRRPASY